MPKTDRKVRYAFFRRARISGDVERKVHFDLDEEDKPIPRVTTVKPVSSSTRVASTASSTVVSPLPVRQTSKSRDGERPISKPSKFKKSDERSTNSAPTQRDTSKKSNLVSPSKERRRTPVRDSDKSEAKTPSRTARRRSTREGSVRPRSVDSTRSGRRSQSKSKERRSSLPQTGDDFLLSPRKRNNPVRKKPRSPTDEKPRRERKSITKPPPRSKSPKKPRSEKSPKRKSTPPPPKPRPTTRTRVPSQRLKPRTLSRSRPRSPLSPLRTPPRRRLSTPSPPYSPLLSPRPLTRRASFPRVESSPPRVITPIRRPISPISRARFSPRDFYPPPRNSPPEKKFFVFPQPTPRARSETHRKPSLQPSPVYIPEPETPRLLPRSTRRPSLRSLQSPVLRRRPSSTRRPSLFSLPPRASSPSPVYSLASTPRRTSLSSLPDSVSPISYDSPRDLYSSSPVLSPARSIDVFPPNEIPRNRYPPRPVRRIVPQTIPRRYQVRPRTLYARDAPRPRPRQPTRSLALPARSMSYPKRSRLTRPRRLPVVRKPVQRPNRERRLPVSMLPPSQPPKRKKRKRAVKRLTVMQMPSSSAPSVHPTPISTLRVQIAPPSPLPESIPPVPRRSRSPVLLSFRFQPFESDAFREKRRGQIPSGTSSFSSSWSVSSATSCVLAALTLFVFLLLTLAYITWFLY